MPYKTNRLLDALPDTARKAVTSRLTQRELKQHQVIAEFRELVTEVHFPIDAVISLVIPLATGETVESAMTGRDGAVGASAALNGRVSLNRAIVQISGQTLFCSLEDFRHTVKEHPQVLSLMGSHEQ